MNSKRTPPPVSSRLLPSPPVSSRLLPSPPVSPQHELLYHTFGRQSFRRTTANLDLFLRRFNQVQLWVVTEVCLCGQLSKRVQLLKKFIKIAAQWVGPAADCHALHVHWEEEFLYFLASLLACVFICLQLSRVQKPEFVLCHYYGDEQPSCQPTEPDVGGKTSSSRNASISNLLYILLLLNSLLCLLAETPLQV